MPTIALVMATRRTSSRGGISRWRLVVCRFLLSVWPGDVIVAHYLKMDAVADDDDEWPNCAVCYRLTSMNGAFIVIRVASFLEHCLILGRAITFDAM